MEAGGSVVEEHGLGFSMACAILVPRLGIEPVSPALAGGFLTTRPPGESCLTKKCSEILMISMWIYGSTPLIIHNKWQYYMQFQWICVFLTEFMGCSQEPRFICSPYIVMDMNLSQLRETVEDRGAWNATVHGVTKSLTWLSSWATTNV